MVKIDSAFFGSMIVNGRRFDTDLIVSWDGEVLEREKSHLFSKKELLDVLQKEPETVIVGTGHSSSCKIEPAAEVEARVQGIELVAKPTPQAAEEFNKLARRKKIIGIFHLTC